MAVESNAAHKVGLGDVEARKLVVGDDGMIGRANAFGPGRGWTLSNPQ